MTGGRRAAAARRWRAWDPAVRGQAASASRPGDVSVYVHASASPTWPMTCHLGVGLDLLAGTCRPSRPHARRLGPVFRRTCSLEVGERHLLGLLQASTPCSRSRRAAQVVPVARRSPSAAPRLARAGSGSRPGPSWRCLHDSPSSSSRTVTRMNTSGSDTWRVFAARLLGAGERLARLRQVVLRLAHASAAACRCGANLSVTARAGRVPLRLGDSVGAGRRAVGRSVVSPRGRDGASRIFACPRRAARAWQVDSGHQQGCIAQVAGSGRGRLTG